VKAFNAHKADHNKVYVDVDGDMLIYVHQALTSAQAHWLVAAVNKKGVIDPKHWMPADLYWEAKNEADYERWLENGGSAANRIAAEREADERRFGRP
jgi:hypothetical protein